MFYRTLGHEDCYERLKLAIALQRGLSVIIGDVGYGKTTIKVALLQELHADSTRRDRDHQQPARLPDRRPVPARGARSSSAWNRRGAPRST